MADPNGPGIVDGTQTDDDMSVGFVDADGDTIDNNGNVISAQDGDDAIVAGAGNDTIFAGNGDDTVYAGAGDDEVYGDEVGTQDGTDEPGDDVLAGEGGSDTIYGMDGNDTIYGGYEPGSTPTPTPGGIQSFNWSEVGSPADGDDLASSFVQNTGSVSVTLTSSVGAGGSNTFEDETQVLDGINTGDETGDANSAARIATGSGQNATTSQTLAFSEAVENVQFRINDIDENSVVKVLAYDAEGNLVEVTFTAEDLTNLHLVDIDGLPGNEAAISDGTTSGDSTTTANSVLVNIPGPVSELEIRLVNLGEEPADVTVSDVFFHGDEGVIEEDSDDVLTGGEGDDLIYGQGGDDLLTGGDGMDTLMGGDDADTIQGATHLDFVYGGEAGYDDDTLDLRGLGPVSIVYTDPESEEGIVVIQETGEAIAFTEIENILFDEQVAPDGIVQGTSDGDVIDINYDGDPNGDFVDNDDAILPGQEGNDDIIIAGEGNDTVIAALDDDLVFTGDGDDIVDSSFGSDTLFGQDGDDYLDGREDDDYLRGGEGNDTIFGGEGADEITGGLGTDVLFGGDDEDEFFVDRASEGIGDEIFGGDGGVDQDELSLFGEQGVDWRLTDLVADSDGNGRDGTVEFLDSSGDEAVVIGRMSFENIEIIPCFTPNTRILTPMGEVAVGNLRKGDQVVTRDNGLQTIRWAGRKHVSGRDLMVRSELRPILIKQGALGPNQPERDMMVSPSHRMLLVSEQAELLFEEREVLVAAKHLTHLNGVEQVDVVGVDYIHFLCDNHEVVLADGAWSESFQPGEYSMNGIGKEQRDEIYALFPELQQREGLAGYTAARLSLKRHEAKLLG